MKDRLTRLVRIERALASMVRIRKQRVQRLEQARRALADDIDLIRDVLENSLVNALPVFQQSVNRVGLLEQRMQYIAGEIAQHHRLLAQSRSSQKLMGDRAADLESLLERQRFAEETLEAITFRNRSSLTQETAD